MADIWKQVGAEIMAALDEAYKDKSTFGVAANQILNFFMVAVEVRPAYLSDQKMHPITVKLCSPGTLFNAHVWNRLNYVLYSSQRILLYFLAKTTQPELRGLKTGVYVEVVDLGVVLGYPTPDSKENQTLTLSNVVTTNFNFGYRFPAERGIVLLYGYNSLPKVTPLPLLTEIGDEQARLISNRFSAIGLVGRISVVYHHSLDIFPPMPGEVL